MINLICSLAIFMEKLYVHIEKLHRYSLSDIHTLPFESKI
jgi:hypothetical protein